MYLPIDIVKREKEYMSAYTDLNDNPLSMSDFVCLLINKFTGLTLTADEILYTILSGEVKQKDTSDKNAIAIRDFILSKQGMSLLYDICGENTDYTKIDPFAEIMDMFVTPILYQKWAENKQVYKADKDFAKALMYTEKLQYTKEMIKNLPVNSFYLDLSDIPDGEIHGAFIYVYNDEIKDRLYVSTMLITHESVSFSYRMAFNYIDDEIILTEKDFLAKDNNLSERYCDKNVINEINKRKGYSFSRKDYTMLCMQTIAYLSSKKPDIEEDPVTKKTYKAPKNGVIKDKFSEVRQWDIGVRYGKAFRQKTEDAGIKTEDLEFLSEKDSNKQSRKSPRPHIRCAHWHRYRYGKNHSLLSEPVWMEPIFVGFSDNTNPEDLPAVIHKIK